MTKTNFSSFLSKLSHNSIPVLDSVIPISSYYPLDLSTSNHTFSQLDYNSPQTVENYLQVLRETNNCKVLYGGYLEERNIYKRSTHFNDAEVRNIHLGIDLWTKEETKVLAVLDGEIHSFKNNVNYGDYGPTLILKHTIQGVVFYSLYGHLSLASIQNLTVGKKVKKSEIIGYLGDATVNGNYAPHLHFQLIRDIGNFEGDYPGVSSQKRKAFYLENCPNPNLLLKLD